MAFLLIYSIHLVESVFKFMTVSIYYKTSLAKTNLSNLILFTDEKFNISSIKKHLSGNEYSFISDLIKSKDLNKKILSFDIISKRKIILV